MATQLYVYVIAPTNEGSNQQIFDAVKSQYQEIKHDERFRERVFRRNEKDTTKESEFGVELFTPADDTEHLFLKIKKEGFEKDFDSLKVQNPHIYKMKITKGSLDMSEINQMKKEFWV